MRTLSLFCGKGERNRFFLKKKTTCGREFPRFFLNNIVIVFLIIIYKMSISDISVYLEQQHNACSSTCVAFILLHYYYFSSLLFTSSALMKCAFWFRKSALGRLQKADCTHFSRTKTPFTPQLSRKGLLRLVRSLRFLVSDLIGVRLLVVRHLFGIRHGSPQFAELLADFGHLHVRVRFDNLRSLVVHEEKVRGQVSFRRVRVFHLLHFLHLLRGFRWSLGHFV